MLRAAEARDRRVRGDDRCARCAGDRRCGAAASSGRAYVDSWKSARTMKLATLKNGTRDGQLVVVSRDLPRAVAVDRRSRRHCRRALDDWARDVHPASRRRAAMRWSAGCAGAFAFDPRRATGAAAARLSMGRRLGVRQSRRARAQGARRGDAGELLDRSARVPGRLGRFSRRRTRTCRCRARSSASISKARSRSSPTTSRWGRAATRRADAHQAADARQRLVAAQSDSRRARQGLRLLSVEACDGVLARRRDARRAWAMRGTMRQVHLPLVSAGQRQAVRSAERGRRHDVRLRPAASSTSRRRAMRAPARSSARARSRTTTARSARPASPSGACWSRSSRASRRRLS